MMNLDKAGWALALLVELLFKNLLLFITLSFMFNKFLEVDMSLSWGKVIHNTHRFQRFGCSQYRIEGGFRQFCHLGKNTIC